jgi:hypothetical protein
MKGIVAEWNRSYFGGRLSQACLDELDAIDVDDHELIGLVDTWLHYAERAGGRARDFSPLTARFFARIAKSCMTSLWAKIPPITRSGRLRVVDRVAHDILGIPYRSENLFYCKNGGLTEVELRDGTWRLVTFDETFFLRAGEPPVSR